ncbi:MAG TPA: hypothetical protein VES20_11625 [Bryobacteraceae bacterium]|nr:hypothetical protein [Bryobacteraceae bacterium]
MDVISSAVLPPTNIAESRKPEKVAEAATQFESLMIAQLLKTARESGTGDGWLGTGSDATADSALQMAEEQFAAMLAKQGGLGLARMVEQGLGQK